MARPIAGYKGGGSQQAGSVESPDNLQSIAHAHVLDLWCEGEIKGFVHPSNVLQDVALNETPAANADGSLNFKNVQFDSRAGTQSQLYMSGFPDVENEIAVGVELKSTAPWTQTLTNLQLSAVRVTLSVPAITQQDATTNQITGYTIQYAIDVKTDSGAWEQAISSAFTGKSTSKYQRQHKIDLPPATTGWTIRVRRLTANQNKVTVADITNVDSYAEIIDAKFRYPNSAYGGLVIDSSQFSSIPTRAYNLYGRIVQIPSNYDPDARTYTGTWDGTFKPGWTNNPAWMFYDVAINDRFGLGQYMPAALVNKWVLYTIARYCDELVPDGFGGTEPRFYGFVYLRTQADAFKVMSDLASLFRGVNYWAGGAVNAVADMPGDPEYTYTAANVIGGKFIYSGSARKTRYTVALVSWSDPADFGRAKVEYVSDDVGIARYGVQITQVTAFGAMSRGVARRMGKGILLSSRLQTEMVSFQVGLDGTIAVPGQIIRVADPARAGKRQGGRIRTATQTQVTLDAVPGEVAVGDSLTCALPSGITETHAITGVSGNMLTVASPGFSEAPGADSVWTVESTSLQAALYRVVGVADDSVTDEGGNSKIAFTISALQHNASKYDAIDEDDPISTPPVSVIPPSVQDAPASVTISSVETSGAVLASTLLTISWAATDNAVRYECEYRKDNGNWTRMDASMHGLTADLVVMQPGTFTARVRAFNASDIGSLYTFSAPYVVDDQTRGGTRLEAAENNIDDARKIAQGNAPLVPNGNFVNGLTGWDLGIGWSADAGGAKFTGFAGQTSSDLTGQSSIPVKPGQIVYVQALLESAGIDGNVYVGLSWNNPDGTQLSADGGTPVTGTGSPTVSILRMSAPAGAASVRPFIEAHLVTTGTVIASQVAVILGAVATQDDLPDGATRYAAVEAGADKTAGKDLSVLTGRTADKLTYTGGGTVDALRPNEAGAEKTTGKSIDILADGTNYRRTGSGYVDASGRPIKLWDGTAVRTVADTWDGANRARTGFDSSGYLVDQRNDLTRLTGRNLDNIADTSSFAKRAAITGTGGDIEIDNAQFTLTSADPNCPFTGWSKTGGDLVYDTGGTSSLGTRYMGLRSTAGGGYTNASHNRKLACSPGDTITLVALLKQSGGSSVQVVVNFYKADDTYISNLFVSATSSSWGYYSLSGTVPTNAAYLMIFTQMPAPASGQAFGGVGLIRIHTNDVRVAGSGATFGDQRNAPSSLTRNLGIVRSATALTAYATGAVNVNAHSIYMGAATIAYNAVTSAVTGLTQGNAYYIYTRDNYAGGTQTWNYATDSSVVNGYDDAYNAGVVTIPTSGSSGGGGGGGGPIDYCVCAGMYLRPGLTARQLAERWRWWKPWLWFLQGPDGWHLVRRRPRILQEQSCTITVADGSTIDCSNSTPVDTQPGESVLAPMLHARMIATDSGWQRVINVELLPGLREVVRICVGGHSFFAGTAPHNRISTHNGWKP